MQSPIHLGAFRARSNRRARLAAFLSRRAPDGFAAAFVFGAILFLPFLIG